MRWCGDTRQVGFSLLDTLVFVSVYVHMKPDRPDTHQYRGASGEKARWVRGMSIAMTTVHAVLPWFGIHILQWKISGKCSFVSGIPHDLNAVCFTQDTCGCWAIIEEAFERFAKDQAVKGMSNEMKVSHGVERRAWEDVAERRRRN